MVLVLFSFWHLQGFSSLVTQVKLFASPSGVVLSENGVMPGHLHFRSEEVLRGLQRGDLPSGKLTVCELEKMVHFELMNLPIKDAAFL